MNKTPRIQETIQFLKDLTQDPNQLALLSEDDRVELLKAAGQLSRPNKEQIRSRNKAHWNLREKLRRESEKKARAQTGIRAARLSPVFQAPKQLAQIAQLGQVSQVGEISQMNQLGQISQNGQVDGDVLGGISPGPYPGTSLHSPRNCYVCKAEYAELHFFYDSMCKACADLNYRKRFQTASLVGQVALITGARVKIGYQAALMMLRAGARVIVTTRFPVDAAERFAREDDFEVWGDRLEVHGLDLRHTPSVEIFARYLEQNLDRLDILINNAAQTVRRPPGFYHHLLENELSENHSPRVQQILKSSSSLVGGLGQGPGVGLRKSAELSQIPYSYDSSGYVSSLEIDQVFPRQKLDADLQQVDLRTTNSWRYRLAEVPGAEMLEVQLVNAVAPFILCSQLLPLMRRDFTGQKHIVNVTAMEGKFHRFTKSDRHPHTNMAKAALNMLTHTSASELAKDGIFMNAVDTGWVTDEDPLHLAQAKQEKHDFQPPLDIVDGAARVCDPFFDGILTNKHWVGKFLKDYFPIEW